MESKLIEDNKGLLYKQLHKFNLVGDTEAISYGYEALYRAIKTYKEGKGSKFSTYATVCIYNALGSYVRKLNTVANTCVTYLDDLSYYASEYTADGDILQEAGVTHIMTLVDECMSYESTKTTLDILFVWKESMFTRTHSSIAEELGCSQTYVTNVINRFRRRLKLKLEEEND